MYEEYRTGSITMSDKTDYISRQAAINALENTEVELMSEEWDELTNSLMEVPSADAQPVRHGHWNWFDGVYCSVCNYKLQTTGIPNYCPNCGALMDERKNS